MKYFIFILTLITIIEYADAQSCDRQSLRLRYQQCFQRRTALDSFVGMLERSANRSAAEESYLGISYGLTIQYVQGMWSKYRVLVKSKSLLNSAVERDPTDPELRFMRLTLEHHIPAFLCMSTHINDDLRTMISKPAFLDENPEMKRQAIEFILDTKRCNPEQSRILEKLLADTKKRMTAEK